MHHQVEPNSRRHSPKRTRTIVFAKEDPDNKAKAKILLPLASLPPLLKKTRTRIRTKKAYPTLSATLVSKKSLYQQISQERAKELALVMTTSTSMTEDSEEAILISAKELE